MATDEPTAKSDASFDSVNTIMSRRVKREPIADFGAHIAEISVSKTYDSVLHGAEVAPIVWLAAGDGSGFRGDRRNPVGGKDSNYRTKPADTQVHWRLQQLEQLDPNKKR